MPLRAAFAGLLAAALVSGPGDARTRPAAASPTEAWVTTVVSRIGEKALAGDGKGEGRGNGTVTVRLRIASDGALEQAAVEEGSGSESLDARALNAVKAASPFPPPPERILTLEGFTELSFPVQIGVQRRR